MRENVSAAIWEVENLCNVPLVSSHALYDKQVSSVMVFRGMSSYGCANYTVYKLSILTYASYVGLAASLGMSNKLLNSRSWWRPP